MMKLTTLFLSMIFVNFTTQHILSQQLITPFPDTNAIWVQEYSDGSNPPEPPISELYKLYPYNRVTINSIDYTELKKSSGVDYASLYDFMEGMPSGNEIGYYRIDGLKVYYRGIPLFSDSTWLNWYNNEVLLYDFGMNVGDTFDLTLTDKIILDSIDSVQINGFYHDRYNFNTSLYSSYPSGVEYFWIEGIGSNLGFFPYFYFFERNMQLWCFYQDYYQVATGPGNEPCYVLGSKSNDWLSEIAIYPNPAGEVININAQNSDDLESIEVRDLTGKLLLRVNYSNQMTISSLESGIYVICVLKSDQVISCQKLIKQSD